MSTPVIAVIAALSGLYVLAAVWVWRRDRRRARAEERAAAFTDLDAHLDEYAAEDPDLWDAFGRGSTWDVQQGLERLRQAIRDEQNKGD